MAVAFARVSDLPGVVHRWLATLPGRLARIPGALALGALFVLFALAGSNGKWLAFPMTAPVKAGELMLAGVPLAAGKVFLVLLLAALLLCRPARGLACALMAAAFVWLLRVPLEAATAHPEWLHTFLVQLGDRLELSQFLVSHYTMNLSPEPTLVPVDRIDGSDGQLRLGFLMLAWPWYLAAGASVGLLLTLSSGWRSPRRGAWIAGALALTATVLLLPPLWQLERAQGQRNAGDRALAAGDGNGALAAYRRAYAGNPGLLAARPFWSRVAAAYAQASGGRHVYAQLVEPLALALRRTPQQDEAVYGKAARAISTLVLPPPADRLEAGLQRVASELRSDFLVKQALLLNDAGKRDAALTALIDASPGETRVGRFYLADLTLRNGGYAEAAALLQALDARLAHPTVRADITCTIGDALSGMGKLAEARAAYQACKGFDELTNYRATKALGGT